VEITISTSFSKKLTLLIFSLFVYSFPYGWCLKNFLGEDSDAVSWDFSMNEGDSADG
jgi:hypothetical protein